MNNPASPSIHASSTVSIKPRWIIIRRWAHNFLTATQFPIMATPLAFFLQDMIVQNTASHQIDVAVVQDTAISHAPIARATRRSWLRPSSSSSSRSVSSRWESSPSQETARKRVVEDCDCSMPLRRPTRRNSTEFVEKDHDPVVVGSPPKSGPKKPSRKHSNERLFCRQGRSSSVA